MLQVKFEVGLSLRCSVCKITKYVVKMIYINIHICAAQSNLQGRHCFVVVGSQCLAHKGLAELVLFYLSLEIMIWKGRNPTISSSRASEGEISFGFLTLMDPGGCTGEV